METDNIYHEETESVEEKNTEKFNEIMENFDLSNTAFNNIHQDSRDDIKFALLGEQWTDQAVRSRKSENRTTAVYNKCAPLIRYVVNQSLRNTPNIKVHPVSTKQKDTAKVLDGLVKHIQSESNANSVYNAALQDAVAGGIGCFEIIIDGKDLKIKRIIDPTSVFPDPEAIEPDFSDAKWLFHLKTLSKKQFEKAYSGKATTSFEKMSEWFTSDSITIAEYWEKLEDGSVCWYIINGNEILDSSYEGDVNTYPGKFIPYCFVFGEDVICDGKRVIKSLIRDVKDYQMSLNYMQSEAIDYLSKTAKAPYIVSDASIGPYRKIWDSANTLNVPYLPYVDGKTPPQRNPPPAPPVGYIESATRIDQDIRASVGIRDPLENIPASNSGKAIQLQISQGNVATLVWQDHLNRAIKHAGRILVDLIQYVYNYPHIQNILGYDGSVNQANIMMPAEDGSNVFHDLAGEWSVTISTGASYEDQRSETFDKLLELAKIDPRIPQVAGDILVNNMDFVESTELADRLRALIPPNVLQSTASKGDPKAQLMQLQQQMKMAMQKLEQMTGVLNSKNEENMQLQQMLQDKQSAEIQKMQMQAKMKQMDIQAKNDQNEQDNMTEIEKTRLMVEKDIHIKELEIELQQLKMYMGQI